MVLWVEKCQNAGKTKSNRLKMLQIVRMEYNTKVLRGVFNFWISGAV